MIGYRIVSGQNVGQGFLVSVIDNGPPAGGLPVDEVPYSGLLPVPPTSCPAPGAPAPPSDLLQTGGGPLTSGDLSVVDARALPTSKEQCKNGGWRSFGSAFRNQGDCVSFVATGGRNRPPGS